VNGIVLPVSDGVEHAHAIAATREALGAAAFAEAWDAGTAASLADLVMEATRSLDATPKAHRGRAG
jgi:hypothetical protein